MFACPKCRLRFPKQLSVKIHCSCGHVIQPQGMVDTFGPGTEYAKLVKSLGFKPTKKCGCAKLMREMDELGVDGCRRDFDRLCGLLQEKYDAASWPERQKAKGMAVLTGLAFKVSWTDPIPDVLNEAIRLATDRPSLPQ